MVFEVTIDTATSGPIQEGDTYEVTAAVTNTGSSTETQIIGLYTQSGQGGTLRDDRDRTIDPGDTVQVNLTWNTGVGDAGNYEVSVESEDPPPEGVDTSDITVEQAPTAPTFPVTIQGTNSPVVVGGTLTVTALVENSGEQAATQQVSLSVDGQQRGATDVTLENGQSTEVGLDWATGSGDAGSYEAVVESETDQDSTGVTVEKDSGGTDPEIPLDVTIDWTNGPITAGEPLCADCTATNTGDTAGVGTVAVGIGNQAEPKKKTKLALDPGESGSAHFTVEQDSYREGNEPEYAKKIWADTGTSRDETTVSVSEPPHLAVEVTSTNAPVEAGEKIKVTASVENTGGQTGNETMVLAAKNYNRSVSNVGITSPGGGENRNKYERLGGPPGIADRHGPMRTGRFIVDAYAVELPSGDSTEVTLEWDTGPTTDAVEPGSYALGVAAIPPWERDEWDGPVFARPCADGSRNDSTVVAIQHGPMRTGRFKLELDGETVPGWSSVTIPSRSTEQDSYKDGSDGETDWGQTTFDDLEMERGVKPDDTTFYDWAEAVEEGNVEEGRKEIAVVLLDENGEPQVRWELQEAWIKDYDPPELEDSADGEVATEQVTVAYDKMERKEQ